MDVINLSSNRPPDRFYRGGLRIAEFRGEGPYGPREPEDWVGSTTTVRGQEHEGLSVLPDGRRLVDAIASDPTLWLGEAHVARWGEDIRLLVKLLDAGQRLPVHAHPSDSFAHRHVHRDHGKAEAWFILSGGTVHIGLQRDVTAQELLDLVNTQATTQLVELLHPVLVSPGDVVWVPPGELHAIGEGVVILELQQPEDLSILLEWEGFALDGTADGHLGLGFPQALNAISRTERATLEALVSSPAGDGPLLPPAAEEYFRLERVTVAGEAVLDKGFGILVMLTGQIVTDGGSLLDKGATALLPAAAGNLRVKGHAEILICRPPRP